MWFTNRTESRVDILEPQLNAALLHTTVPHQTALAVFVTFSTLIGSYLNSNRLPGTALHFSVIGPSWPHLKKSKLANEIK